MFVVEITYKFIVEHIHIILNNINYEDDYIREKYLHLKIIIFLLLMTL